MSRSTVTNAATWFIPECPDCHDLTHPGATVCESCGTHLFIRQNSGRPFTRDSGVDARCLAVDDCTCGHTGICTRCVMFLLDHGLSL